MREGEDGPQGWVFSDLPLGIPLPQVFKKGKSVIEFLRSRQFPVFSEGCMLCYIMLCNAPSLSCIGIKRIAPGRSTNMRSGWCSHLVEGCNRSCPEQRVTAAPLIRSNIWLCFRLKLDYREVGTDLLIHPCPGLIKREFCQHGSVENLGTGATQRVEGVGAHSHPSLFKPGSPLSQAFRGSVAQGEV